MRSFLLIISMLLLLNKTYSEDIEVTISADKTIFSKYNDGKYDYLKISTTFKNNSKENVFLNADLYLQLNFNTDEGSSRGYCFRMYPLINNDNRTAFNDYKFYNYSSFINIAAEDEVTLEYYFDIGWLCRSAPPIGVWVFDISFSREIKIEDNYYLVNGRYTDLTSKEYIKAWVGKVSSNKIQIIYK